MDKDNLLDNLFSSEDDQDRLMIENTFTLTLYSDAEDSENEKWQRERYSVLLHLLQGLGSSWTDA